MRTKSSLIAVAFALLWLISSGSTLFASGSHEGSLNTNSEGIVIDGYDPVAYFTLGEAVAGQSRYSYDWGGGRWYFSSAEHRDIFAGNPERYAPVYGGYCAWAVAQGDVAGINPHAWHIEGDRLYLNYSQRINRRFLNDLTSNIESGDRNWPEIRARLEAAASD